MNLADMLNLVQHLEKYILVLTVPRADFTLTVQSSSQIWAQCQQAEDIKDYTRNTPQIMPRNPHPEAPVSVWFLCCSTVSVTAAFLGCSPWSCLTARLSLPLTDLLLPENRRRLPLEEQLHYLQVRLDEVSSGKHSIGQSRRAKALRKEISVIKRKLAHQREGGSGMGGRESVGGGDRGSSLPHHPSSAGHHDEGGESSSQEIGGKGVFRKI